jgi:hypothetical protein
LAYIAEPAERYGPIAAGWATPRRRVTASEREELRELAVKISSSNHDLPLQSWLVEQSIARMARTQAGQTWEDELVEGLLALLEHLGFDISDAGPKQEPQWTLQLWKTLHPRVLSGYVDRLRELFADAQAFPIALGTLDRDPPDGLAMTAFFMLHPFYTSRALDWIESHVDALKVRAHGEESDHNLDLGFLGDLAAVSEFSWPRAETWLGRGRPLSLVALDALLNLDGTSDSPVVQAAAPKLLDPAPRELAARILRDYAIKDRDPWVETACKTILKRWPAIVGQRWGRRRERRVSSGDSASRQAATRVNVEQASPSDRGGEALADEPRQVVRHEADWSKLPPEFAYIAEAAEEYGPLWTGWPRPRRRVTASERKVLRELAAKIAWSNHELPLRSWLIEHLIARDAWGVELIEGLLGLLEHLGFDVSDSGPKQEPQWTLQLWETLHPLVLVDHVDRLREVVPDAQAYSIAISALDRDPPDGLALVGLCMLGPFRTSRSLDWIESHLNPVRLKSHGDQFDYNLELGLLGALAAVSQFSWPRAETWLGRRRPLSLVALSALMTLDGTDPTPVVQAADPKLLDPAPRKVAARVLGDYTTKDRAAWVESSCKTILKRWSAIVGQRRA